MTNQELMESDGQLFKKYWRGMTDDEREFIGATQPFFAACEIKNKAIAEKDLKIAELEEQLNNSLNFHCPHFLTNESGTVSCHDPMKDQLKIAVEALQEVVNAGSYMTTQEWALLQLSAKAVLDQLKKGERP